MRLALLALALALPAVGRAAETAAFLKVGLGARALGLGGAYTAIAQDANAIAWNPAGLSALPKGELAATHAELGAGTRYESLGFAQPTRFGTLAAAGGTLAQGAIEARDDSGRPIGSFSAQDSFVSLGFGSRPRAGLGLGATIKLIQSRIASYSAGTYAVDLGSRYALERLGPGVPLVGLAVQNLGPGMTFLDQRSALPLTLAAGLGYRLPPGLTLAADYKRRPNSDSSELDLGTEYALLSNFAVRAGYASNRGASAGGPRALPGALNGFAAGFGVRALGYSIDYSLTPFGPLGNAQRFSLSARF